MQHIYYIQINHTANSFWDSIPWLFHIQNNGNRERTQKYNSFLIRYGVDSNIEFEKISLSFVSPIVWFTYNHCLKNKGGYTSLILLYYNVWSWICTSRPSEVACCALFDLLISWSCKHITALPNTVAMPIRISFWRQSVTIGMKMT